MNISKGLGNACRPEGFHLQISYVYQFGTSVEPLFMYSSVCATFQCPLVQVHIESDHVLYLDLCISYTYIQYVPKYTCRVKPINYICTFHRQVQVPKPSITANWYHQDIRRSRYPVGTYLPTYQFQQVLRIDIHSQLSLNW